MSARDLGYVGLKLLGIYCAVGCLQSLGVFIAFRTQADTEGWPSVQGIAWSNLVTAIVLVVVSSVLLIFTDTLSRRLFRTSDKGTSLATRQDLMAVVFAGIGVWFVMAQLPEILTVLARTLWYSGADRQALLVPYLKESAVPVLSAVVVMSAGLALLARNIKIAAWVVRDSTQGDGGAED